MPGVSEGHFIGLSVSKVLVSEESVSLRVGVLRAGVYDFLRFTLYGMTSDRTFVHLDVVVVP